MHGPAGCAAAHGANNSKNPKSAANNTAGQAQAGADPVPRACSGHAGGPLQAQASGAIFWSIAPNTDCPCASFTSMRTLSPNFMYAVLG